MVVNRGGIGYFSTEFGVENNIPVYAGGLGILAGDHLKAAADLGVNLFGVGLWYDQGYFRQRIENGWQKEEYPRYDPSAYMTLMDPVVSVDLKGDEVRLKAWRLDIQGASGHVVPLYLLDAHGLGNKPEYEDLTGRLYGGDLYKRLGGDEAYRIMQEAILGIGGVRMLRALGYEPDVYHKNEGHAAFLALELLNEYASLPAVMDKSAFTIHTPVPAGLDNFDPKLVKGILGDGMIPPNFKDLAYDANGRVNMAVLALNTSRYSNGVSEIHGKVSRDMFPGYGIDHITNGVHAATWAAPEMARIFDRFLPGWRQDATLLSQAVYIPLDQLTGAKKDMKARLLDTTCLRSSGFDNNRLTFGSARRFATYKRGNMLVYDTNWLRFISDRGAAQYVFAGKAHPHDQPGKEVMHDVVEKCMDLSPSIAMQLLENYNMDLSRLLVQGVDVWMNTPRRPMEASGTSGMKAGLNGTLNFSVLDGWWNEVCRHGVNGWAIGPDPKNNGHNDDWQDASDMYLKIHTQIMPVFYNQPQKWAEMMRQSIADVGSRFNTHRMVRDYFHKAYYPGTEVMLEDRVSSRRI